MEQALDWISKESDTRAHYYSAVEEEAAPGKEGSRQTEEDDYGSFGRSVGFADREHPSFDSADGEAQGRLSLLRQAQSMSQVLPKRLELLPGQRWPHHFDRWPDLCSQKTSQ